MGFTQTLIYAADTLEALAGNRFGQAGGIALVLALASSFVLGEFGARLRAWITRFGAFALIGACGMLAMVSVKGVPEQEAVKAPAPPSAERRVEAWIERQQRRAAAQPERPRPPAETRPAERKRTDYAEARRALERERAEIERIPEAARTLDQRRRDARAVAGLAEIDRAEGRIEAALARYRAAQRMFALLADSESRRARVEVTLETAAALEERHNAEGDRAARAAYTSAIEEQRALVELPERERRDGLATALLRYAQFEISQRAPRPARAALDEAGDHYAFLRAQRGRFDVLRARAGLALAVGDLDAARSAVAAIRKLLTEPGLASAVPEADIVEARVMLADGREDGAEALFDRAASTLRRAAQGRPDVDRANQQNLAAALLGRSEVRFLRRDLVAARGLANEAVAIRRALGERVRVVETLVRQAVWEAAAGEEAAAGRVLVLALEAQRDLGELRTDRETEGAIRLLCAGALRAHPSCWLLPNADAPAAGP